MPIYEFHCAKCEQDSEILVRSSKWKGAKCPNCGSGRLSKKLSVFASSVGNTNAHACGEGACETRGGGGGGCCGGGCCGGKHRH